MTSFYLQLFGIVINLLLFLLLLKRTSFYKKNILKVKNQNIFLDIIEALSYLPSSKSSSLEENLYIFSQNFFKQNNYWLISFVLEEKFLIRATRVFRFYSKQKMTMTKNPDKLEKYLLSQISEKKEDKENTSLLFVQDLTDVSIPPNLKNEQWQTAVVEPLLYQKVKVGYLIFFSEEKITPNSEEREFLITVANLASYLFRRYQTDERIPLSEQLKAVDAKW